MGKVTPVSSQVIPADVQQKELALTISAHRTKESLQRRTPMSNYIFDNAAQQASQRFASLETLYDPWTIRHLEATGIGPGWQCWEVGGGGGSIARWPGERCGPTGHVLLTDIDPRFLVEALRWPIHRLRSSATTSPSIPCQHSPLICYTPAWCSSMYQHASRR